MDDILDVLDILDTVDEKVDLTEIKNLINKRFNRLEKLMLKAIPAARETAASPRDLIKLKKVIASGRYDEFINDSNYKTSDIVEVLKEDGFSCSYHQLYNLIKKDRD